MYIEKESDKECLWGFLPERDSERERDHMGDFVYERQKKKYVNVWVLRMWIREKETGQSKRDRERSNMWLCVQETKEKVCVFVCVCVCVRACVRERKRKSRESDGDSDGERESVCVCVCAWEREREVRGGKKWCRTHEWSVMVTNEGDSLSLSCQDQCYKTFIYLDK